MGCSFLLVLAGDPLRTWPATLLVRSRPAGAFAGRLGVTGGVGGALLGLDPFDGRAGPLPSGSLGRVVRHGAEGSIRVGDAVAAPIVLDRGGGLAPGPPAPGRLGHRAEGLKT